VRDRRKGLQGGGGGGRRTKPVTCHVALPEQCSVDRVFMGNIRYFVTLLNFVNLWKINFTWTRVFVSETAGKF
jgi:hypothetical protein